MGVGSEEAAAVGEGCKKEDEIEDKMSPRNSSRPATISSELISPRCDETAEANSTLLRRKSIGESTNYQERTDSQMALGWTGNPEDFFGVGSALSMLSQNLQNFNTTDLFSSNPDNPASGFAQEPAQNPVLDADMDLGSGVATSQPRQEGQHKPKVNSLLGLWDEEQVKQGLGAIFDFFSGKPAQKQEGGEGSMEQIEPANVDGQSIVLVGVVERDPSIDQAAEAMKKQGTLDELRPESPLKQPRNLAGMDEKEGSLSSRLDAASQLKDGEKAGEGVELGEAHKKEENIETTSGTAEPDASQAFVRPSHVEKKSSFETDVERTSQLYGGLQLIDWNGRCMPFNSKRLVT